MKYLYLALSSIILAYIIIVLLTYLYQRKLLYHPSENNYTGDEIQFDNKESELRPIDDSKKIWITSGEIEVIELNRELKLELPEADDHYTLAGFVLEKLQEIPNTGETLVHNEIIFEIISMKGPRINKVKIILPK